MTREAPAGECHPRTPYGRDGTSHRHRSVKWLPAGYHGRGLAATASTRARPGGSPCTALLPEKARRAQANLEEAGLASFVEIRVGDAMQTLRALDVLKLVAPALRPGAVVVTDNVGVFKADYVTWVRDPRNGFASMTVPFRSGTEYPVRQAVSSG